MKINKNNQFFRPVIICISLGAILLAILLLNQHPKLPDTTPLDSLSGNQGGVADNLSEILPVELKDVNHQAFNGKGNLAFTRDGILYSLDGDTGQIYQLSESGQALYPKWSHDGQWLAYLRVNDPEAKTGSLWITRKDGKQAHQLQGLPEGIGGKDFQWSPTEHVLAVGIPQKGLWLAFVDEEPKPLIQVDNYLWFAWSPDGKYLAYNVTKQLGEDEEDFEQRGDALVTIEVDGGEIVSLVSFPGKGIELTRWWPDGQGLLFWLNPALHSSSTRADGLELCSLSLEEGNVKKLTWALAYNEWLSFSPQNDLLMVNGIDRVLYHEKQLAIVHIPDGNIHYIDNPSGKVSLDPAFSPDGSQIAFVMVASDEKSFYEEPEEWEKSRTLWLMNRDGTEARPLTTAGQGVFQPRWSKDGSSLLYLRDNSLWLIDVEGKNPQKIIGSLSTNSQYAFYGHVTFDHSFAWFQ